MYLLKLALRPWRIAPWSQVFSAVAVGFLLVLMGFLFWIQTGLRSVVSRLQNEQVITLYLASSLPAADEEKTLEQVKFALSHHKSAEISLVRSIDFIQNIKSQYPDLSEELKRLGPEFYQIVPRYVSISGVFTEPVLEKLKGIPGVESAESSKNRYQAVVSAFFALRWILRVMMVGLAIALVTGLIHLSKMNSHLHQEAVMILKFWGAHSAILSGPNLISGLIVGLTGGIIAWASWFVLGHRMVQQLRSISTVLKNMPPVYQGLPILLLLVGCLLGLISGYVGTLSRPSEPNKGVSI